MDPGSVVFLQCSGQRLFHHGVWTESRALEGFLLQLGENVETSRGFAQSPLGGLDVGQNQGRGKLGQSELGQYLVGAEIVKY